MKILRDKCNTCGGNMLPDYSERVPVDVCLLCGRSNTPQINIDDETKAMLSGHKVRYAYRD